MSKVALDPDSATMRLYDVFADVETQAESAAGVAVTLPEPLEDVAARAWVDAGTAVTQYEFELLGPLLHMKGNVAVW